MLRTPPADRRTQLVLMERAFHLLDDMQARHVDVCDHSCPDLLVSMSPQLRRRLTHAKTLPVSRTDVTCDCCSSAQHATCLTVAVAQHWLRRQEARLQPDAPIWNGLITLAGRAGQLQRAFQVLEDMQASSCKPNARTFAALIDACSRAENTEMALRVYQVRGYCSAGKT